MGPLPDAAAGRQPDSFRRSIEYFASLEDRSAGTPGCRMAADYIKQRLQALDIETIGSQPFRLPVLRHANSTLSLPDDGISIPVHPLQLNAISPETIAPSGLEGPLVYVGDGDLTDLNGKTINGAVVMMALDSGRNWQYVAELGARALIYIDEGNARKHLFDDKYELTPIDFPRFWLPKAKARQLFGDFERAAENRPAPVVRLTSQISWQEVTGENIYALIPGTDPELRDKLIIIDAFYDSSRTVTELAPGADEAVGIATLLELARYLKQHPPGRSILLVATGGHAQTLSGMREMIWAIKTKSKVMKQQLQTLQALQKESEAALSLLQHIDPANIDEQERMPLQAVLDDRIKTEVDLISRQLMKLRLQYADGSRQEKIRQLADRRLMLRRLTWRSDFTTLSRPESAALARLIPLAQKDYRLKLEDATRKLRLVESAKKLRALARSYEMDAFISLHLSSHGDGFGAFNQGWLHPLKSNVNRFPAYTRLVDALDHSAKAVMASDDEPILFRETLRPSRLKPWQSYFLDRPPLGGEVSALAGYLGFSLVTLHDARCWWQTPYDTLDKVDLAYARRQSNDITALIQRLSFEPRLQSDNELRNGFSTVTGHARLIRHGELFADKAAARTMILAYHGPARYHLMTDSLGDFELKGVPTKKLVLDKVIIEGFRFDPDTGEVIWAIDKKQTGKPAYRLKMRRRAIETDLIMFACRQTTMFNLLEPRNFNYMTKIQLLDGRREALPVRYWYSRIDTRDSNLLSIYLEPGTPLKLTLSDTVLRKKMILTNATRKHSTGKGYLVDQWPVLTHTVFKTAQDMWALVAPRIGHLEKNGIFNAYIRRLQEKGMAALKAAEAALKARQYDRFYRLAATSWALAGRVYDDVEKTQKDVLFGVLFYIALFVPFAFCMERLAFGYTDIHKRIIAFTLILIGLIAVIYNVHPAFKLAYSPTVVILAFFIMGLSLIVTLIIFFRFEQEMILLQRRAQHIRAPEVSRWKAFVGAFFLGVSNLRRRRLRTALTCVTLIILTFTIMSFTTVKTLRSHTRLAYRPVSSYKGLLFKNINWKSLPPQAADILSNTFEDNALSAPRVWLENPDRTRSLQVPVRFRDAVYHVRGVAGFSAEEDRVSGIAKVLTGGRWFDAADRFAVLLPERVAAELGLDRGNPRGATVLLWGMPFEVIGTFSGEKLQQHLDLDGEPLTPVTFPSEVSMDLTEVEMEALESGEDIRAFQGRYQHIAGDLTIMLPYRTLMTLGGELKSVAVRPGAAVSLHHRALELADRFGIPLFSGESQGTFLYAAGDMLNYSGVPHIVIPLIISVLIVLNTMIGSVYERKREIAVYTSVGLAPLHVSFIFIAEAMAFAVLSVVLGYLLAQSSAALFADTALWAGLTVNYSSVAGVAAMVLVILVVLISVIYPSKVAARIAIPDVNRSWTLPPVENDRLELVLPFLMRYSELKSIGGFLFTYFKEHQDVSHGIFSTADTEITFVCPLIEHPAKEPVTGQKGCTNPECGNGACLQMNARVWLAPFDFGIMQHVTIRFCPAVEEEGFLEINVNLRREAGEANTWERINKAFLHQLRKQLLVWRSLDVQARHHFEALMTAERKRRGVSPAQCRGGMDAH
jgi:ABC-type transporter Mla MlaB component